MPETEGKNAFSFSWSNKPNLFEPPTCLIQRAIEKF